MLCSALGWANIRCLLFLRFANRSSLVSSNSTGSGGGGMDSVGAGGSSAVISCFGAEGSMGVGGGVASALGCVFDAEGSMGGSEGVVPSCGGPSDVSDMEVESCGSSGFSVFSRRGAK